jgi:hypothetical protein
MSVQRLRRKARRTLRQRGKPYAEWLFNSHTIARLRRREHVLCIGDSHVTALHRVEVPGVWFWVDGIAGATASGVLNPNSSTRSGAIFKQRLRRAKRWQQVLLQLGEVDCGFVIWQRAQREGLSVEQQLAVTLDSYESFIRQVLEMGFARVIVLSAPLPTIGDLASEWVGPVASARKEVKATQLERTRLTMRFNESLAERCEGLEVVFVDATSRQLDPSTGLIDSRFLRATNLDHHLATKPYARLISERLAPLWGRGPASA